METPNSTSNGLILLFLSDAYTLCRDLDASVTSWFRTPARNSLVGGVPASYHLRGLAVDCVLDHDTPENRTAFAHRARQLGLRTIDERDHIHVWLPLTEALAPTHASDPAPTEPQPRVTRTG